MLNLEDQDINMNHYMYSEVKIIKKRGYWSDNLIQSDSVAIFTIIYLIH